MNLENESFTADSPQYEKKSKKKFAILTVACLIGGMILGFVSAIGTSALKELFTGTAKDILSKLSTLQIFVFPLIMLNNIWNHYLQFNEKYPVQ